MESMLTKVIRILLGLLLVFAGLNKFFGFAPNPQHNAEASAFLGALVATGYLLRLVAIVEIATGLAFLAGRYVALATVVLAPLALNIVLFHVMLDLSGAGPGLFVGAATLYLLVANLPKYQDMLAPR
ncbi:MAG TPA: DoxX family membrane protein [Candidatus Binatia bacterium]|jgi:uncharacterized membrane protein YphA (DoxX/SURF4 family)